MGHLSQAITSVGGRRILMALGGLYIAVAGGSPLLQVVEGRAVDDILIIAILAGSAGFGQFYSGYRLPRTEIRPDLYYVLARWCIRATGALFGILLLVEVVAGMDDPVATVLILTPLASVAGLGMGFQDATAKTRARNAEEQRQEAEQQRREAERYSRKLERANRKLERYETIVETVNDGIFVADADNRFTLVNDAYTELVGYDREELLGSPTTIVAPDDEETEAIYERVERDLKAGTAQTNTYETTLQTATGEQIEVEWTLAPLPEQEGIRHDRVVVVRDVTERNERERQLKRQNEQLDNFASMLAHELRNPVAIGQIYCQQLPRDENPQAVEYVTEAFDRVDDIIDIMLFVARGREAISERSSIQLADTAREAWAEVDVPEAILEVTTGRTIEADKTYIHHLFRNLFENAVEHGGSDVTVTVGDLPTGFYVADDGRGIDTEEQETVFKAGYTSKGSEGGMGLGLTFVQEMANVYGWKCSVTESDADGARFEFEHVTRTQSIHD